MALVILQSSVRVERSRDTSLDYARDERRRERTDNIPHDGERMLVILGKMVDNARLAGVQVAAAQILSRNLLARRRLDQRRAGEEDRALVADDDALIAHRGDIGAAGGAAAHHAGDLGDALGAHLRRVEEDAAEMVAVGEHLGLMRQVGAAAVDQIDARQPVLLGDLLRAQMLLDRQRIVRAAFDRRVVADDHHLAARDPADAGDDAGARHFALVHVAGGELPDLEEWRARVEQTLDAVTRQKLAAQDMAFAAFRVAALRRLRDVRAQLFGERAVVGRARAKLVAVVRNLAVDTRRAHAGSGSRCRRSCNGASASLTRRPVLWLLCFRKKGCPA